MTRPIRPSGFHRGGGLPYDRPVGSTPTSPPRERGEPERARPLDLLTAQACRLAAVMKTDLRCGDWVVVTTQNSVYALCLLEDGTYSASGGWFDRHGDAWPARVRVNGCTFGGRAIKTDVVAAPGLFLEFDNQVTTTRIREARVLRGDERLH